MIKGTFQLILLQLLRNTQQQHQQQQCFIIDKSPSFFSWPTQLCYSYHLPLKEFLWSWLLMNCWNYSPIWVKCVAATKIVKVIMLASLILPTEPIVLAPVSASLRSMVPVEEVKRMQHCVTPPRNYSVFILHSLDLSSKAWAFKELVGRIGQSRMTQHIICTVDFPLFPA